MIISDRLVKLLCDYELQGKLMVEYITQNRQEEAEACIDKRMIISTEILLEKHRLELNENRQN